MIEFNCEKCRSLYKVGAEYAGKKVRCNKCASICLVPKASATVQYFYKDVRYAEDGITPNFDDIFRALLKHERQAPAIAV
ncbi:MAG: hypothetical protein KAS23_16025 [Anaerohalosphaera sp.]|nr:hypothetical protein [Anaerohalosphaera sp.]